MATILIVDERALKRDSLELLGYHGHRLLQIADGEDVLEIIRAEKPTWCSPTS